MLISRFMINLRATGSGNIGSALQDVWSDDPCDEENDAAGVEEEGVRPVLKHETATEIVPDSGVCSVLGGQCDL